MALIIEVECRIMTTSRHDPSIVVESSRRRSIVGELVYDDSDDAHTADVMAREIGQSAVALEQLATATVADALEQASTLTGRVREDLG